MNTLLGFGAVLAVVIWLIRERKAAAIAATFLLFSLVTRTLALVYVDLGDPIYAIELNEEVGGDSSMPLFAASVLMFLLPLAWLFRPTVIGKLLPVEGFTIQARPDVNHVAFAGLAIFLFALYGDMIVRGPIPLLDGIDRLEYTSVMAGPLHSVIMEMGFLFAGLLGVLMVIPRIAGREFDFRFLALFIGVMAYFALTGNRFSAFFAFTSFFMIPTAAVATLSGCGRLQPPSGGRGVLVTFLCSRMALVMAGILMGFALMALLLNSYVTVRGYDDPLEQIAQRTLVQPVQLWWTTWHDLQDRGSDVALLWDAAFGNPLDASRNTSIQALMVKNLGYERATELLDAGQQYAGGYPEILFELFGPFAALPIALAFGLATAWLLRLTVVATSHGHLMTATLSIYVFYGFSLLYIGGMLNFLLVWTFWVKCGCLAIAMLIERNGTNPSAATRTGRLTVA
jgi:hypothetical protein